MSKTIEEYKSQSHNPLCDQISVKCIFKPNCQVACVVLKLRSCRKANDFTIEKPWKQTKSLTIQAIRFNYSNFLTKLPQILCGKYLLLQPLMCSYTCWTFIIMVWCWYIELEFGDSVFDDECSIHQGTLRIEIATLNKHFNMRKL